MPVTSKDLVYRVHSGLTDSVCVTVVDEELDMVRIVPVSFRVKVEVGDAIFVRVLVGSNVKVFVSVVLLVYELREGLAELLTKTVGVSE